MTGCYEPTWQACRIQAGLPVLNPGTASTAGHAPHVATSGRPPLAAYSLGGVMLSAFFLLSSPEPGPGPKLRASQATAARDGEGLLERVCGVSRGSPSLYSAAVLSARPFELCL